jgi:hypothetical protein
MVRKSSYVIGLGLALLWWIGLSLDHSATLLWFDAVGAVVAFAIGGLVDDTLEHNPGNAFGPALLGLGLAAVWITGIATHQPAWATWVQVPFAVACLAVAVVTVGARRVEVTSRMRRA